MKTIEVVPTGYDIRCLYQNAVTAPQRDLLGYMIQTGRTDNLTLGGAFRLLSELNSLSSAETYKFCWESEEAAQEIIAFTEAAKARVFRKFSISRREVKRSSRNLNMIM